MQILKLIEKHLNSYNQYVQENWILLKISKIGLNGYSRTQSYNVKLRTQQMGLDKKDNFGVLENRSLEDIQTKVQEEKKILMKHVERDHWM